MLSFWEKQSFLHYDYLIVGSGIVGLSAAASLIEKDKNARILVLERGIFPTGASTKNAGFACFGSLTEILADLKIMSSDQVVSLVNERYQGLLSLRKRLGDTQIGFLQHGGYELISEKELPALEKIDMVNDLLFPLFENNVYELKNERISQFGFDKNFTKSLVFNPYEGQIDTGKMMQSLLRYVQSKGVTVLNQCEVMQIEDIAEQEMVKVWVKNYIDSENIVFSAPKIIVCTNAFTSKFFPLENITAGRGQVLVTEPIPNLKIKGTFHFDEGFYYFRNFENQLIFGGGRNIDFETENTLKIAITQKIMNNLEEKLRTIILPNQSFQIAHRWAGIMAFGKEKKPIVKYHSPNIILAVRMGGMGVAIGTQIGKQVADLACN
ncbi:NAD(P)/FAD-dependent oxidoreductase [Thermoflexibacter ruber]|uniref:Glycine/D-amino acid oxidase n=1 Tax=Thermoflexibacter ruber TaxID=1003 RepID=A0A1I2B230_9BACT|nr:FAD-dependent oxidoreductase [Thermoflexibacter ruber]SFE50089.1 Glycine/D-amino acid oxidase [Thermoflexibacter ruber]